jgi:hypothetical protein
MGTPTYDIGSYGAVFSGGAEGTELARATRHDKWVTSLIASYSYEKRVKLPVS